MCVCVWVCVCVCVCVFHRIRFGATVRSHGEVETLGEKQKQKKKQKKKPERVMRLAAAKPDRSHLFCRSQDGLGGMPCRFEPLSPRSGRASRISPPPNPFTGTRQTRGFYEYDIWTRRLETHRPIAGDPTAGHSITYLLFQLDLFVRSQPVPVVHTWMHSPVRPFRLFFLLSFLPALLWIWDLI